MFKLFHKGFTLAEVLITLGIIGIVAAMTLPALIQKNNSIALETAFKKAYSNLYNAYMMVIAEEVPVFVINPSDSSPSGLVDFNPPFARAIYDKYKKIKKISAKEKTEYKKSAKNFTRTAVMGYPQCSQFMNAGNAFITPDGSTLSIVQNCGALWFTIDTNGIKKGPNALGHDIFIFQIPRGSKSKKLTPATSESEVKCDENGQNCGYNNTAETREKCSRTSKSDINGATCAAYAIQNKCPGDDTKTYWECLP